MSELTLSHESSLLLTLEEISQLVSHSHHPWETLANIVRLLQGRFHTDVCSVYLFEPERGELVLGATLGLKLESVGRVRMRSSEGLTGLVAERMAPVMEADAFAHPRFKYFPEAGEDPYHSFLGVPLVEGGTLQGVLVVQTHEPRSFSLNEVRMLVAVGAQLAPLVGEAKLLEQVVAAAHQAQPPQDIALPGQPLSLQGSSLSPGLGSGQAYLANGFGEGRPREEKRSGSLDQEKQRLAVAMDRARDEIARLSHRISSLVGEDHGAILQGQLMILQDSAIEEDLTACMEAGDAAETALLRTLDKYVAAFQKLTNPFFQERVYDIKDVFRRILWHLRPSSQTAQDSGGRLVLVAHEASVMDLFSVDLDRLAGVIVEHGGPQSHAAILARSLGIPMVGQVHDVVNRVRAGRPIRVNGTAGEICLDPSPETLRALEPSQGGTAQLGQGTHVSEMRIPGLPRLEANVNLLFEVRQAVDRGAGGVGLYRSEFLFLARRTLPTEEEQFGIYRKLLHVLEGRPASIRTFDLRPDKVAYYSHLTTSASHTLDWRLVLESPPLQKLFKDQVRAIYRAAAIGPARILVPLVTRTEQLAFVTETLEQAKEELKSEGFEFSPGIPVGIMIEVAAATAMIESWAKQVDFFALGTNDLIASALGIDRDDPVGASRDDPLHPGLLRIIHGVVEAAHAAKRQVTVCGEMASDPQGTLALAALQVDSISVAVNQLASVRETLGKLSSEGLLGLAGKMLHLHTASQVRATLRLAGNA